MAPEGMGRANALRDTDLPKSRLPKVTLSNADSSKMWRLAGTTDAYLLLVHLSPNAADRTFRLAMPSEIAQISAVSPYAFSGQR